MSETFQHMVFCDFDGTITVNETLRKVLHAFVPEAAERVLPQLDAGTLSLRDGVIELIAALRCDQRDAIIAFTQAEPLRAGFAQWVEYLARRRIPLVIVSSGLDFYIRARLQPWQPRIHAIHALDVDCSGTHMQLRLDHDHPREAMPKEWVLRRYQARTRIAVGDSLSDFEMVKAADRVFARDRLLQHLQRQQRAVTPFEDFFDIIRAMDDTEEQPRG